MSAHPVVEQPTRPTNTRPGRTSTAERINTPVRPGVWLGVDTHQQTHHAALCDSHGTTITTHSFPASAPGYHDLIEWAHDHGTIVVAGIESTGSYGAGLTRALRAHGTRVVEVNRPDVVVRVTHGKSDPIDAVMAARAVLTQRCVVIAKETTGTIEAIRVLTVARRSAVKARSATIVQLRDLLTTAPDELRDQLLPLSPTARVKACRALRPGPTHHHPPTAATAAAPLHATKTALRSLARRITDLDQEIHDLDTALEPLVRISAPTLIELRQVGIHTAAQLLITAGQNIDRIHSEAAFARLCGVAPIPASSGKTNRMRLHRGGDRQANRALYLITIGRLRSDPRSRTYLEQRTTQGLTKNDIIRCLKRYTAREIWHALHTDLSTT